MKKKLFKERGMRKRNEEKGARKKERETRFLFNGRLFR
jgi:hypothetical protein